MRYRLGWMVAALVAIGCQGSASSGNTEGTAIVKGSVPTTARSLDNARAIAISPSGQRFSAYLDGRGSFTLTLPSGQAYRLVVANGRAGGGAAVIGHVQLRTVAGTTRWLAPAAGATLDLGALRLATTAAAMGASTALKDESPDPKSGSSAEPSSSSGSGSASSDSPSSDGHDSEFDTHEDDDHEKGSLCHESEKDAEDDAALEAEHEPSGDDLDDESEHEGDDEEDGKPCPSSTPPAPPATSTPPAPPATSTPPASAPPPPPPGNAPPGGPCAVTASCAPGLSCIASICRVPIR